MPGIECLADSIKAELEQLLPEPRKTQRGKLSLANPLVDPDAVMAPVARQVLERLAGGEP